MLTHTKLLESVSREKKLTFISTGMSTLNDIKRAVNIFKKNKCDFVLMHCVSTYPMQDEHANLNTIATLKEMFQCDVGYSGHENGTAISISAAALGVSSLERHITLDRTMYGSDQAASLEPLGLKFLVGAVRKGEMAMGDGVIRMVEEEIPIAKNLRQHLDWSSK